MVLARDFRLNWFRRVLAIYRTSSLVVRLAGVKIVKNLKQRGVRSIIHIHLCSWEEEEDVVWGPSVRGGRESTRERKSERARETYVGHWPRSSFLLFQ